MRRRGRTLRSSLIFGALYQVYGALAVFGWGAALALVGVAILPGVRGRASNAVGHAAPPPK